MTKTDLSHLNRQNRADAQEVVALYQMLSVELQDGGRNPMGMDLLAAAACIIASRRTNARLERIEERLTEIADKPGTMKDLSEDLQEIADIARKE
ncbi:MAG: hypothetical protein ACR2P4_05535 [Gammaproteobacteria bacterium]